MLLKHATENHDTSGIYLEYLQMEKYMRKKPLTVAVEKGNRTDLKRLIAQTQATIRMFDLLYSRKLGKWEKCKSQGNRQGKYLFSFLLTSIAGEQLLLTLSNLVSRY